MQTLVVDEIARASIHTKPKPKTICDKTVTENFPNLLLKKCLSCFNEMWEIPVQVSSEASSQDFYTQVVVCADKLFPVCLPRLNKQKILFLLYEAFYGAVFTYHQFPILVHPI